MAFGGSFRTGCASSERKIRTNEIAGMTFADTASLARMSHSISIACRIFLSEWWHNSCGCFAHQNPPSFMAAIARNPSGAA
jgi:hypothetical protein